MKGSELLLRCLENEGVQWIFGVPGEETLDVLDSLVDSQIRFIAARHEQGAAFMADVHGRLTGKAGVCLSTLGPGATNLLTGVADAYLDRAPLVAITGQASLDRKHKESHQIHRRLIHVQAGHEMERRDLSPPDHGRDGAQSVQGRADRKARLDSFGIAGGRCGGNGE